MPADHARWVLLGKELRRRRIQLGHPNLQKFARETPGSPAPQVLSAIEAGARDNYVPVTIDRVEYTYQLKFGAIERFLAGRTSALEADDSRAPDEQAEMLRQLQESGVDFEVLRDAAPALRALADAFGRGKGDTREERRRAAGLAC
jgi:hypothetical protein